MLATIAIVVAGILAAAEDKEDRAVFSQSVEVKRESNAGKTYVRTVKARYVDLNGDGVATVFNLRSKSSVAALLFVSREMPVEWAELLDELGEVRPPFPEDLDGMDLASYVRAGDNKETYPKALKQFGRPAFKKAEREVQVLIRNYNREQRDKGRSR